MRRTIGICVAAAALTGTVTAQAADHIDSPGATQDNAADISDFYAWQEDDKIVAAIAFAGFDGAGSEGTYDRRVLYGIHIDNDGDQIADQDVWIRFGDNADGDWGVQIQGLPGGDQEVVGPINTVIDAGLNLQAYAGVRDDPFFFDFDGFGMTTMTGTLSFDGTRDSFRATNVTMIIVEMSIDGAAGGSDSVELWATTGRRGNR